MKQKVDNEKADRFSLFLGESMDIVYSAARNQIEGEYGIVRWWKRMAELCESPIEKLFLVAWMARRESNRLAAGSRQFFGYDACGGEFGNANTMERVGQDMVTTALWGECAPVIDSYDLLYTQVKLDKMRVDFVVTKIETAYIYDPHHPKSDENQLRLVSLGLGPVIVECDGHEYHDKTKEQAQRDKKRDRDLQSKGYKVFRFTGSELYKDPWKCVAEVDGFFKEEANRKSQEYVERAR